MSADAGAAMTIRLNGNPTPVAAGLDLAALLDQLGLTERRLAVEVNAELVPRSRFAGYQLQPDDQVEIIHAVGGG